MVIIYNINKNIINILFVQNEMAHSKIRATKLFLPNVKNWLIPVSASVNCFCYQLLVITF